MKKNTIYLTLLFAIFSIPLISAQFLGNIDLGEGMREIIYQITEFLRPVLEIIIGDYSGSEFFFAKVMVLLLMLVIIYWILNKIPLFEGYRNITIIISLIVSILSVRFMSENELIAGILLPYGTLGVAITTILPFFIFAYGIHATGMPGLGRKIGWVFFGVVFIVLWITKYDQLNKISNYIYIGTIATVAIMLAFDKSIHAYFRGQDIRQFERVAIESQIANLQADLNRLLRESGPAPSPEQRRTIERIRRRLRNLGAKYEI